VLRLTCGKHHDALSDMPLLTSARALQSALRVTSGERHAALAAAIKPHMQSLKTMPHGKRILQQLQGSV
jgi:hypothetical protein